MKINIKMQTLKVIVLVGVALFLAFRFLGYSQLFSGFFAVIGAIASGWIATWWNSPDEQRQPASKEELQSQNANRQKQTGIIATQRRMKSIREKRKFRDRASEQIFSWLNRR